MSDYGSREVSYKAHSKKKTTAMAQSGHDEKEFRLESEEW